MTATSSPLPLHLDLLAIGAVTGAVAAVVGSWRPSARVPALVAGAAAAAAIGGRAGAPTRAGAALLGALLVVIAALAGAALARGPLAPQAERATRDRSATATWVLVVTTLGAGVVYLSVPDTEAAVVLGGFAVVAAAGSGRRRRPLDASGAGALVTAMATAVLVALWTGAGDRRAVTPLGWWPVKVVAAAAVAVAAVLLTRWRARPPR